MATWETKDVDAYVIGNEEIRDTIQFEVSENDIVAFMTAVSQHLDYSKNFNEAAKRKIRQITKTSEDLLNRVNGIHTLETIMDALIDLQGKADLDNNYKQEKIQEAVSKCEEKELDLLRNLRRIPPSEHVRTLKNVDNFSGAHTDDV